MSSPTPIRVAVHEASHAVMALNLRKPFTTLTIIPEGDYLGACFLSKLTSYRPDLDSDVRTSQISEKLIMICFAGAAAERIRFGTKWNAGAGKDYEDATDVAARECGSWEETKALMNLLQIRTASVLRQLHNWASVLTIADSLLQRRKLSYREVKALFTAASMSDLSCCKCKRAATSIKRGRLVCERHGSLERA